MRRTPNPGGRGNQRLLRLTIATYGAVCHLCLRAIRLDLPPRHPDGPTRDHVVPTSKGGPDTLENSRPAHGRCNYRRGNRALTPDLLASFRRPIHAGSAAGFFDIEPRTSRLPCPFPPEPPEKTLEPHGFDPMRPGIA